ncbi:hypothetical protein ACTQ34_11065, partial [Agathobaculum sp. LCP25S3_E8]|uniref:hypothetical protein n=1 Tax=Agathobaculum sp. LCP25S3_E8 TaxID=3438735 RepID=UPI003F921B92
LLEFWCVAFVWYSFWHNKAPHLLSSISYCLTNGVQFRFGFGTFYFFIAEKVEYNFCKKYGIFLEVAQKWPNLLEKISPTFCRWQFTPGIFFSSRQLHRPSGE